MTKEEKAYQLLQHPEEYPSLVKRRASDRKLLLFRYPEILPYTSWSLFRFKADNNYWLRRIVWVRSKQLQLHEEDPDTYGCEVCCPSDLAKDLLLSLSLIALKPFARSSDKIGIGGSIYGIVVEDFHLSCSLRWWDMGTPDEWKILEQWCDRAIESVEKLLPENSYKLKQ